MLYFGANCQKSSGILLKNTTLYLGCTGWLPGRNCLTPTYPHNILFLKPKEKKKNYNAFPHSSQVHKNTAVNIYGEHRGPNSSLFPFALRSHFSQDVVVVYASLKPATRTQGWWEPAEPEKYSQ